mgnify:CR=1 FL=1
MRSLKICRRKYFTKNIIKYFIVCFYSSQHFHCIQKALAHFHIDPADRIVCDIGASNGGFTDCLLQNGAQRVFAVDVAYGILDYKLRIDEKVTVLERTNARNLTLDQLGGTICDMVTVDVSFISLKKIYPAIHRVLKAGGEVVTLIKPQFEAGKENVGKKGVVRDPKIHQMVLGNFVALAHSLNFKILGLTFSPVKGPEGNIEFLGHLSLDEVEGIQPDTAAVVAQAHKTLD